MFVAGEGVEVGVVVGAVCLFDDWEGLADEWLGVAGVVWERVDESLAAACGAVGVGVVAGPAEVAAVGAGAGEGAECVFEPADAAVEVGAHGRWLVVGWCWSAWRSSQRVVSSRSWA